MTRVSPVSPLIVSKYYPTKADGNRGNRIELLIRLVGCSPRLVVTGTNQNNSKANTRIGKTTMFESPEWLEYLKKNRLSYYHHNPHHNSRDLDLSRAPMADVYVFDEIHYYLPGLAGGRLDCRDVEVLMGFWVDVARLSRGQSKIIFVTAMHPRNPIFRAYLEAPVVIRFLEKYRSSEGFRMLEALFQAPIMELPERSSYDYHRPGECS